MDNLLRNPCGNIPFKKACYLIASADFLFFLVLITTHTLELIFTLRYSIFSWIFALISGTNLIMALMLVSGVKQKNLRRCQLYILLSLLILLSTLILYILSFIIGDLDKSLRIIQICSTLETILYPLYLLYKVYSLLVVRCFIVDMIRSRINRDSSTGSKVNLSFRRDRFKMKDQGVSGVNGVHNYNTGTVTRGMRRESEYDERVQGIEDIFHQVEFPMDNQLESDRFRIGDELLKMEHDFFVKKGLLEQTQGNFGQVSVKIFRQNVDVEAVRRMLLETKILTMFRNHNNVIKLLGFCTENIHKGKMTLILEYSEKGNLEDFLRANYEHFQDMIRDDQFHNIKQAMSTATNANEGDENIYENVMGTNLSYQIQPTEFVFNSRTLLNWAFQISNGMEFICQHGVVHGNLSTKNCIVDDRHRIKIGNFTFATQLYHFRETHSPIDFAKIELPWRWMAIECMQTDPPLEQSFTEKSDTWSYGVSLWELFSLGCVPYDGQSTSEFFPKLLQGKRLDKPPFATTQVSQLMQTCWLEDPQDRPTFSAIKLAVADVIQNMV